MFLTSFHSIEYRATTKIDLDLQNLKKKPTNPASIFIIQSFQNWLEWLLSLQEVEEMIELKTLQPHTNLATMNN
jgi:hypothetical protein